MTDIIIYKKSWLRGEGAINSYLLRPSDNQMCCLGQLACQRGLNFDDIRRVHMFDNIAFGITIPNEIISKFLEQTFYLGSKITSNLSYSRNSNDTASLISIVNDNSKTSDKEKEIKLKAMFSSIGYNVTFVDQYYPGLEPKDNEQLNNAF